MKTVTKFVALVVVLVALAHINSVQAGHLPQTDKLTATKGEGPLVMLNTSISYQGRLLTTGGSPANGLHDFQFKLFDAAAGGVQVGATNVRDDVAVSRGAFTATLDFGGSAFTGEARYLEISVRPGASTGAYTTLAPRQLLTAVPYAFSLRPGARIEGAVSGSDALRVVNLATTGYAPGIYAETRSSGTSAIRGFATATTGTTQGVFGQTEANGANTTAVFGVANAVTGHTFGVWGKNQSTDGSGVSGYASAITGTTYGVSGQSDSPYGRGVYGQNPAYNSYGFIAGGWIDEGPIHSATGTSHGIGVYGNADTYGVQGASTNIGVHGIGNFAGVVGNSTSNFGVRGEVNSGKGVYGWAYASSGFADGVWGRSNSSAGSGVVGEATGGGYAGYFFGNIQVTGNCTGCNIAVFGVNADTVALAPGTTVGVRAVRLDAVAGSSPLLAVSQAQSGEGYVGVVLGRAELVQDDRVTPESPAAPRLVPRSGEAVPGDYVVVMTHGLTQVKASSAGNIRAGDRLTVNQQGMVRTVRVTEVNGLRVVEDAPILGIALESVGPDGMLWLLVNPQ